MNPNDQYSPAFRGRYRFLFLGFSFPILHYVIMLLVQAVATVLKTVSLSGKAGLSQVALEKELTVFLTEYSDVFSLISAGLTVLVTIAVYFMISSRFVKWQIPAPSVKTYFSLNKISTGLVFKLILLAFFFYHFVLGFLNVVGLLAPSLMESYNDASQSVDTGKSAFSLVLSFFSLVVAAPITEELIYRNMAIANMRSRLPAVLSVILSSLIFGLFHGNVVWMLYAGGIGVLFGFLYVKSESIYVSLTVHIGFNFIGYVYSVIGNFVNGSAATVINTVSACLISLSLVGAPLVFLWVWFGLSKKEKPIE